MNLFIEEIKKQSIGKSWNYLFSKYLDNIHIFLNEVTTQDYKTNPENIARLATIKLQAAILTADEKYIFEIVDYWGVTCFEYFKNLWLQEKDAEWERIKISDRMNYNQMETYSWENK